MATPCRDVRLQLRSTGSIPFSSSWTRVLTLALELPSGTRSPLGVRQAAIPDSTGETTGFAQADRLVDLEYAVRTARMKGRRRQSSQHMEYSISVARFSQSHSIGDLLPLSERYALPHRLLPDRVDVVVADAVFASPEIPAGNGAS